MTGERPPFLIDLHVHTTRHSFDSGLKPEEAVQRALAARLGAICFTEHNATWPAADALELGERLGLPVLRGMEVSTDAGHVLVFGLERHSMEMARVEDLRRIVLGEGALMVLAHPMREPTFGRPWSEAAKLFDGLEALNADDSRHSFRMLEEVAAQLGIVATGGSDAHSAAAVGRCATAFEEVIGDEAALIAALRERKARPVVVERPA